MKSLALVAIFALLPCACQTTPSLQTVEVTREVLITVQVTQIVEQTIEREVPVTVQVTSLVERKIVVTATPELRSTQPPTTPTPPARATPILVPMGVPIATSPPLGVRSNPVPFGQAHEFVEHGEYRVRMRLIDTRAGQEAHSALGRRPAEGSEYFLATFEVSYLEGPTDKTWGVYYGQFRAEADLKLESSVLLFETGVLNATSLYAGGEDSGWIVFVVPSGADVTGVYYQRWTDEPRIWFAVQ